MLLKIAADEYPHLKLLATGSSTLHATHKFRDALTDRKRTLHLPPVLWQECLGSFNKPNLDQRLLHGGFPALLLSEDQPDPSFFEDWIDSFYARDVQELFGIRNRTGFLALLRLICMRNGGQLDITDLAKKAGLSRPTVMSHLDAMEIGHVLTRLRPFHGGTQHEITRQPRIYAYDTGLVCHVKGWEQIREQDRGYLWENLVLDELRTVNPLSQLYYWRDKSRHEIDFISRRSTDQLDTIEAKINPDSFSARSLSAFRELHPHGNNYVVCPFVREPYSITRNGFKLTICLPSQLPHT